ncbi:ABC transporter permease [Actinoplanes sp. NBC_00393]|uniref:ABC transporter permease n=1 Tax=Actinoplanes sp. NBC_00393 TaxID=2975953 RepID=UPI002E1A7EA9
MLTRDRIGSFVAVVLGTVLVTTFLLLLTSARPRVPDRFAGAAAVVASPAADNRPDEFAEPVPWTAATVQSLADRIRAVPGVTGVTVDRDFYAQPVVDGRPVAGSTRGHAWPGADPGGAVVNRDLGIPVGAPITVLTGAGPVQWQVSGHTDRPGVHVAEDIAARLGPGVRAMAVTGDFDTAAVRAVVGAEGRVLTGDQRGAAEPRADARLRWIGMQVLSGTAAVAGFAAIFLVASTAAYEVNQRRREIGLLRAVGATPRQIRSMLHRSALLLGAGAAAVGVLIGSLIALVLAPALVRAGLEPYGYAVLWQPWVLAVAFLAGPLISLAGAAVAARRVSRVGALEALRVAEVEPRAMSRARWTAGLAALAAAAGAGIAAATSGSLRDLGTYALMGAMALIAAAALLAPAVVPALIRFLLAPLKGIIATLARESARTAVRRTASTAAPVLFTVAFAVFVTGTVQTGAAAFDARRSDTVPPGQVLVPSGTPGLSDAAAGRAPLDTTVYVDGRAVVTIGADRVPAGTALVGAGLSGSAAAGAGYGSADAGAGDGSADAGGASDGSAITVTYADGATETLRVTGAPPDGPFAADLVISRDTARRHDPSALAPAVYPAPPGPAGLGARIAAPADLARQAEAEDDRLIGIFTLLLLAVSAGAGALAVTNTLLMTARHRRPDYRVLRLSGASGRQVLRAIALETTCVVAIGTLLGGGAGMLAVAGSARSLSEQVGHHVPVLISWPVTAGTVLLCLLCALAAATLPAARLVRRPAAD